MRFRRKGFVLTQEKLSRIRLKAGDGAKGVHVRKVAELMPGEFGIPDHPSMIRAAHEIVEQRRGQVAHPPMKIVVGSQSAIKIQAVQDALAERAIDGEVVGVKAASNAPEQPLNDEGILGARNRVADAKQLDSTGDVYLAIENFVREQDGRFLDIGVVVASTRDGREQVSYSDGVGVPSKRR